MRIGFGVNLGLGVASVGSRGKRGSAAARPLLEFSPSSRPAGTTMLRQGRILSGNAIFKTTTSGLITESTNLSPYTDANGIFRVDGATENIIAVGDSITEGTFAWESWVPKLIRGAWVAKGKACSVKNRGLNGYGFNYIYSGQQRVNATITADAAASVDPCIIGGLTNWLVIFVGTNDMALNGASASACWTLAQTYINARKTAGFVADNIVMVSCLPRAGVDHTTYNGLISSNKASMGYRYVDLTLDARLTNTGNATYYTDGIHPTDAGQQIIADAIRAVMFP